MKKNNLHKIDLIFIIGIISIGMFASLMDVLGSTNFPVYSCISIYWQYALWIILLIYSAIAYKEEREKPKYVKWYCFFVLPFFHIMIILIGFIIFNIIINIFNL